MEEINTEVNKTNTFLSHMFSFDNDTKNELMNIGQYAILSIVPLVALVKLIDGLVANFDPTKGNIELVGEILVHLTLLIIAESKTLLVPSTLVFTASTGKNSQDGTCLSAAA